MSSLEVNEVYKMYGTKTVVDAVSFSATGGEILGVLGPNGAGKTTTIRMIMGITAPDKGAIRFTRQGTPCVAVPKLQVGYLPEERGLYKEARVMEILVFLAGLKDVPKALAIERATAWLAKFGLEKHASAKIEELSKGMAQKVQFISSILHEPEFIVLDEPFSGLDPVSQEDFKAEIRALAERGTTVLLSSHQMNIVEELCDRIFLIHQGKKVVYGSVQSIKEQYGNYRVHIVAEGDLPDVVSSPLVEQHSKHNANRWSLLLREHVTPAQFLATIPEAESIKELSVNRMSLHDIFIKIAKGGLADA